ncbi:MAG: DUF4249 family protein [Ignavibacteria bacterium]|nr:DUF4249 family protein [Ignavibacteria bacterium]
MMRRTIHTYIVIVFTIVGTVVFNGCEDPIPTDLYVEQTLIEALLTVNQPVEGVLISRSTPIADTFRFEDSFVRDAQVMIYSDKDTMRLVYRQGRFSSEYYCPDTTKIVQPLTRYNLRVQMQDGRVFTSAMTTPSPFVWKQKLPDILQFPKDTNNLQRPDFNVFTSWEPPQNQNDFVLRLRCLDTLEYGKYLNPPTEERNRRVFRFFENTRSARYRNTAQYIFLGNATASPVAWLAFKWYGKQEVSVLVPESNYLRWFKQRFGGNTFNPLLTNIEGGAIGAFGAASEIKHEIFILKNQR